MAIRITQNQIAAQMLSQTMSRYNDMANTHRQLSDGLRITKASDDLVGANKVLDFDRQISDVLRYKENAADGIAFLNNADSALQNVTDAIHQIRELTVQAASGHHDQANLDSIAISIAELKEIVRDGMNAKHGDLFMFSGSASSTAPYLTDTYAGNNMPITKRIGDGQTIEINNAGDMIFGSPASILDDIEQLVLDLRAGNRAGISNGLTTMTTHLEGVTNARTRLGANANRLEAALNKHMVTEERLLNARTQVAEVDFAEAMMRFSQQQTAYNAALASGTKMLQTSILNFI